jgi:membrane-bound metal-dependent hydrolase YbcI (DUF457 family)
MDNLAHTLVGAVLGRAVGDGRSPRPALVGAIAANAPDWGELLIGFRGRRSDYYTMHRGITHSFLGAAVEIVALTLLVGASAWWWERRRGTGNGVTPPAWRWIALTVGATVLSHLFMDWQGSYGLRPFLPWSDRWYYGDWVAIVDPFFWLLPLLALAWGAQRHWRPLLLIAAAGVPMTVLVLRAPQAATWVKSVYSLGVGLGAVGWVRHWFGAGLAARRHAAIAAVLVLAAYTAAHALAGLPAQAAIRRAAVARLGPGANGVGLTVVGHPFTWEPIYANADTVAGPGWALPRRLSDPRVRAALATSAGRAMSGFARFLVAEVDPDPPGAGGEGGVTVLLRDARYARRGRSGWAVVAIRMAGD